jgi:hypothetical protein
MDALAIKMNVTRDQMIARMASLNFLKVPASISDTAKAAVFLASDRAPDDRNGRELNGRSSRRLVDFFGNSNTRIRD